MSIDLFTADFSRVTDTELYTAVEEFTGQTLPPADRTREGYTVDFKEKWGDKSLRVVAAFANTFGGIVLVGVSEDSGRAKDLVGEDSKGELKTRLAASIAAGITPTPGFEIAECALPGQPNRRLAVIRVRATNRIHFLTTGDSPVYVRNEDQAIPARAAELRNLIIRERDSAASSATYINQSQILNLLPITKTRKAEGVQYQTDRSERIAADSVLRVWVVPDQTCKVALDYDTELTFRDLVFKSFPTDSFQGDLDWTSSEEMVREKHFVRIDYAHVQRDLESKWVFTSGGEFGYGTVLSERFPPGGPLWSLSDLTIELIAAARTGHALLANIGYLGEAHLYVFANPGTGELFEERGALPFIRHNTRRRVPSIRWQEIVPRPPRKPTNREVVSSIPSNFHTRTEALPVLIADLLNQMLRDLGFGAVLAKLREYAKSIAN